MRERAQVDHRKELEARDEIIALLKEKLSRQSEPKSMGTEEPPPSSSKGSGCTPALSLRRRLGLCPAVDERYAYHYLLCLRFQVKSVGMMRTCLSNGCES